MNEKLNRPFLGKGWHFPPMFNKEDKEIQMVAEETDIQQSLEILLSTRPGERVMQPDYGCNLDIMIFEPLTTTLVTYVKDLIKTAILYFEPRIDLLQIQVRQQNPQEGKVIIEIDYIVRSTNSRFNFVYPFYIQATTPAESE